MCRSGVFCVILLALSACTSVRDLSSRPHPDMFDMQAWQVHQTSLESLQTWSLKGRVAGKSNNEGFQAGVRWVQNPLTFSIDLHGPLGRKTAVLSGMTGQVQLSTSRGKHYFADDPEILMQNLLGYALPVAGLQYWVRGIPDPDEKVLLLELDAKGRLLHLRQAGWDIDYNRYHEGQPALPALVEISSPTLYAKIIVDRWYLDATLN